MNAFLSNENEYSCFTAGDRVLRFRTPRNLLRYERVKKWDKGYIVVDATYDHVGTVEDYIDLNAILENLRIDPQSFWENVDCVQIRHTPQTAYSK